MLRIIVFYLMLSIIALLIIVGILDWTFILSAGKNANTFYFYRDIILLIAAVFIIYFSVSFYRKNNRDTEFNYQKLFSGSPLPIYVMVKESLKIIAVNESMTRLYGYTEHEFLKMTAYDIRPKEEYLRFENFLNENDELIKESGKWLHRKKNGDFFYVEITFHSIPLVKGEGYLVMVKDVDKSINDEKKISDLLHLYETVNKATNDVIWDYNLLKDELDWMPGYFETYGYTKEESPNSFWAMKKIYPDDRKFVQETFNNILIDKTKEWSVDYRYVCANGNIKYVRDRGYVIFNGAGEPVRMIGALQDIDKQKEYEQQLLTQNKQLKEIGLINSHQVRRPLSNIIGLINLIQNPVIEQEEILQLIQLLSISSNELNEAVILINRQTMEEKADPDDLAN